MSDRLNRFFDETGKKLSGGQNTTMKYLNREGVESVSGQGETRGYFTEPDDKLSDIIKEIPGINRTNLVGNNPSKSPLEPGLAVDPNSTDRFQQQGFTPVSYYKTSTGEYFLKPNPDKVGSSKDKLDNYIHGISKNTTKGSVPYGSPGNQGELDFKFNLKGILPLSDTSNFKNDRESFDGSYNVNSWEKNVKPYNLYDYKGTPFDNEDPIYYGFDIIIDVDSSPLFNGDVERFINSIGSNYTEIRSLSTIINSFKAEVRRYFKTTRTYTGGEYDRSDPNKNLFGLGFSRNVSVDDSNRREHVEDKGFYGHKTFYVKRISGLEKLVESNDLNKTNSFVKYGDDLITLSFYEDISLNTGGLFALYKSLYWSRLKGKNLIPENLLRFDCFIICSEMRNMVRVINSGSGDRVNLKFLTDNLSRYVYKLYECQFHIPKMTHPDTIDMWATSQFESQDITMSFKYSNMKFERFIPNQDYASYKSLDNGLSNPVSIKSMGATNFRLDEQGSIVPLKNDEGLNTIGTENSTTGDGDDQIEDGLDSKSSSPNITGFVTNVSQEGNQLADAKTNDRINIYNRSLNYAPSTLEVEKDQTAFQKAANKLLDNIKTAALNEAQRQINSRFRIINNTFDRIRNSFGIGRMSEPTNVYKTGRFNTPFFYDVRNSLRNFAGDVLGGIFE